MTESPEQHDTTTSRRHSPVAFLHILWFILGGGLWALWSPWGALLLVIGLGSAYVIARALVSPANVGRTRASLDKLTTDLTDLRAFAEHPGESPDAELRALEVLRERGLIGNEQYEARRAEIEGQQTGGDRLV
jgi:hypothetical protein